MVEELQGVALCIHKLRLSGGVTNRRYFPKCTRRCTKFTERDIINDPISQKLNLADKNVSDKSCLTQRRTQDGVIDLTLDSPLKIT